MITWINARDGNAPNCFIGLLGNKNINRDEFLLRFLPPWN